MGSVPVRVKYTQVTGPNPRHLSYTDVLFEPDDRREVIDDEACPADQRAVNIRLAHEAGDVRSLHRSTVENASACCSILIQRLRENATKRCTDILCLLGSRSLTRTDCPDGLIGDDDV